MLFTNSFQKIILNLKNIPGWHTARKIIVLECDDWGGIRIPSKDIYDRLRVEGLSVGKGRYRYDTRATEEALERLFGVLRMTKDFKGHCAIMSPVTNVANPDFDKIRQSGYTEYYYEKFTDTLLRYGRSHRVFDLWLEGLKYGIFVPELHGREHISVQLWLEHLREGNKDLQLAFDHGLIALDVPGVQSAARGFRPEL